MNSLLLQTTLRAESPELSRKIEGDSAHRVLANRHHPSIKVKAEISDKEINFLDTTVYKGERFHNQGILDIRTHFKPTETFQYTHFSSCNPHGVREGLIKGETLRLLRTNSSAKSFYENIYNLKKRLRARGYPHNFNEQMALNSRSTTTKRIIQRASHHFI